MAASLDDVLPPEYFRPDRRQDVITFLRDVPIPKELKRQLLGRWARQVGVQLLPADYNQLSGGNYPPRQ